MTSREEIGRDLTNRRQLSNHHAYKKTFLTKLTKKTFFLSFCLTSLRVRDIKRPATKGPATKHPAGLFWYKTSEIDYKTNILTIFRHLDCYVVYIVWGNIILGKVRLIVIVPNRQADSWSASCFMRSIQAAFLVACG
jgi:hypothetical protein